MTAKTKVYCPFCDCPKPMWKAGVRRIIHVGGRITWKQQYECKGCRRHSMNPRKTPRKES